MLPAVVLASCPTYQNRECSGHGTCVEASGGSVCQCEEGYTRSDCSYADHCPGNCGGRGRCVMPDASHKRVNPLLLGTCFCDAGFAGERCTELANNNEAPVGCEGFCMGHGKCNCGEAQRMNVTRRVRVFDSHGRAAQDATVTEEVRVDVRGERTAAQITCGCTCNKGYKGFLCEETDGSNCPNACSGRGSCAPDGTCVCDAGFSGSDCSKASVSACEASCSGHGSCLSPPICACHEGYGGRVCDELAAPTPPPSPPPPPPPMSPSEEGAAAQKAAASAAATTLAINASAWPQYRKTVEEGQQQQQQQQGSGGTGGAAATASVPAGVTALMEARAVARSSGCSGRGFVGPNGCVCADGFAGPTCESLSFACAESLGNCSGHGHCMGGMCACEVGASGAACETVRISAVSPQGSGPACLHSCSGHGTCLPTQHCACDRGFAGESCNVLARVAADKSLLASLAAYATTSSSSSPTPPAKLVHQCANSCSGHGRCLPVDRPTARGQVTVGANARGATSLSSGSSTRSGGGSLASRLLARMGGHVVGDVMPVQVPAHLSHRTMELSSADGASPSDGAVHACACEPGYTGHDCSTSLFLCPHNCSGSGLCSAQAFPSTGEGAPTYVGEVSVSQLARAPPTCLCQRGYTGVGCEVRKASCPNDCSGRGNCVQSTVAGVTSAMCSCAMGYTGHDCMEECSGGCSGHGRCVRSASSRSLVCLCNEGRGGPSCEHAASCPMAPNSDGVHAECSGRGSCASGLCSCEAGYYGHDCSRDGRDHTVRASSCPGGCSGHGACISGNTCACIAGYVGAECATRSSDATLSEDEAMRAAVRSRREHAAQRDSV